MDKGDYYDRSLGLQGEMLEQLKGIAAKLDDREVAATEQIDAEISEIKVDWAKLISRWAEDLATDADPDQLMTLDWALEILHGVTRLDEICDPPEGSVSRPEPLLLTLLQAVTADAKLDDHVRAPWPAWVSMLATAYEKGGATNAWHVINAAARVFGELMSEEDALSPATYYGRHDARGHLVNDGRDWLAVTSRLVDAIQQADAVAHPVTPDRPDRGDTIKPGGGGLHGNSGPAEG
jgi:hypothetical protein